MNYKVTVLTATGGCATVTSPKSKSAAAVTIPTTVTLGGRELKVTGISAKAFKGCTKLKSVTIGKNVKKIGKEAFQGDENLSNITFKGAVLESVGSNAIKGIHQNAKFSSPKKAVSAYRELFTAGTGYTSKMTWNQTWTVTFKNGKRR